MTRENVAEGLRNHEVVTALDDLFIMTANRELTWTEESTHSASSEPEFTARLSGFRVTVGRRDDTTEFTVIQTKESPESVVARVDQVNPPDAVFRAALGAKVSSLLCIVSYKE